MEIGFVLHEKGEFVEDPRQKSNGQGSCQLPVASISHLVSRISYCVYWVGLAEFTLIIRYKYRVATHKGPQTGGIIPDFWAEVKEILLGPRRSGPRYQMIRVWGRREGEIREGLGAGGRLILSGVKRATRQTTWGTSGKWASTDGRGSLSGL